MDKQNILKQLPLIYFERKSANHLTYVKSFSGNKWLPDKGYAVKVNTKTIGKINNANGNGLILFTTDFVNAHPVFKDYGIKRIVTVDKVSGVSNSVIMIHKKQCKIDSREYNREKQLMITKEAFVDILAMYKQGKSLR